MDTLDYTGPKVNEGSKGILMGIGEPIRELGQSVPQSISTLVNTASSVSGFNLINNAFVFCPGCLVVDGASYSDNSDLAKEFAQIINIDGFPLVIIVDDAKKTIHTDQSFLWTVFTRFEPAGDIHSKSQSMNRHHISYSSPLIIDARMKPWYPKELNVDPETKELVDRRWGEYF